MKHRRLAIVHAVGLGLVAALTAWPGPAVAQNGFIAGGSAVPFGLAYAEHVSNAAADSGGEVTASRDARAAQAGVEAPVAVTGRSGALVINATFDSSITSDPNSMAIQAMINDAITIYGSLFNDPITVSIRFRYATTAADGSLLAGGTLAQSTSVLYLVPWNTYVAALSADATTINDAVANASLPGGALTTNLLPTSAGGRAAGLNTPPAMFADGSIGVGGPYDGIVTLNSSQAFKFTRPSAAGFYDALRATEHEIDEVLGLGSGIGAFSDLRPQDLFSWKAVGMRNVTSSGARHFSIDGGVTNLVGFNQNAGGDYGDWLSGSCPQATPYVQNAFGCDNQVSDVTATSPEGVNLDVVGYDLITTPPPPPATCGVTPIGGCDGPGKGALLLRNDADNTKDRLLWKWIRGPLLAQGDFGNPDTGTTTYTLCIYDDNNLEESIVIPAITNWDPVGTSGYQYTDAGGSVSGVNKILLKGGAPGKSKILVKGTGGSLPQPALPFSQSLNVTVQLLRNDDPQCWETVLSPPATTTSNTQFKDKF